MNCFYKFGLFIWFIISPKVLYAQEFSLSAEIQNSDPLLYNGKFYTFYPPPKTKGNQFFKDHEFEKGSLKLRGIVYSNQMINYDIFNQLLILRYELSSGNVNRIIVSDAWLESFTINGVIFEIFSTPVPQKKIFQVLGSGTYRILYHWKKDLELDGFHGSANYVFSKPEKEMNLFSDGEILSYQNNKSFYSLFGFEKRALVRDYLKNHKLNVKRATDREMSELISYCNNL
jgi:hypothetical protein